MGTYLGCVHAWVAGWCMLHDSQWCSPDKSLLVSRTPCGNLNLASRHGPAPLTHPMGPWHGG